MEKSMEKRIDNLDQAEVYLKHVIKEGKWERFAPVWPVTVGYVDGARGHIAAILKAKEHLGTECRVYCFFKREWFNSFSRQFDHQPTGPGQSINVEALRRAVAEFAEIGIVMPDRYVYHIRAQVWHDYMSFHNTVRRPSTEHGYEGSIPSKMLKVIEPI